MIHPGTETFATNLSIGVGFIFSLLIFSALAGDNALSRLAQHILVGASLGYLAVLVLRDVLQPRLFTPLLGGGTIHWQQSELWVPLVLGFALWVAGLERMVASAQPMARPAGIMRRFLQGIGVVPVALLVGTGVAVGLVGLWQGTLLPQLWQTANVGLARATSPGELGTGLLTLLLTTATLLFLSVQVEQQLAKQPILLRQLFAAWIWLGKRAVWVAAGVIFARLVAARLSLLIGRLEFFLFSLNEMNLWHWAASWWRG